MKDEDKEDTVRLLEYKTLLAASYSNIEPALGSCPQATSM